MTRRAWLPDAIGIVVVCFVVLIGYAEVPFAGKSFSGSARTAGVLLCGGIDTPSAGVCPGEPGDPRVDLGAGSWALEPWAQVTHRQLSEGDVPLWNPYQGLGAPLAANMQSAVFDPLLLAVHIEPSPLVQDLSLLLGLLLVGIGAFAAARATRLTPLAATVAGCVYALSGWFFIYSNNHWFRAYLYLPFAVACIEWSLRSTRRLPVVLLALTLAGSVLVGMPEETFVVFMAAGVYSLVRLFNGPRAQPRRAAGAARLALGAAIGVTLTAPLLMVFAEYEPLSFNVHANLGDRAPPTLPMSELLNWVMPKITAARLAEYSLTRNWVGAGAVVLAVVALTSARARRRYAAWPLVAIGALMAFQIYGGGLVSWTRFIPLWAQVIWPVFGTPVIAFAIAMLAATGVQTLLDGSLERRSFVMGLGVLGAIALLCVILSDLALSVRSNLSVFGGWPLALVAAAALVAVVGAVHPPLAGVVCAVVIVLEIVLLAPRGFYDARRDPYRPYPWLDYVIDRTAEDASRVSSTDILLYPNTASVYGLSDPRTLDALYPDRYWRYLRTFVLPGLYDRFTATPGHEPPPDVTGNPMFDLLGVRYLLVNANGAGPPQTDSDDQYRLVYRDDPVLVYENTHVAPRAFVAHDVRRVGSVDAAVKYFETREPGRFADGAVRVTEIDPTRTAVVEADRGDVPANRSCASAAVSAARVVSRSAGAVKIEVDNSCPGLLVLSDQYYPGWSVTVNGHETDIHPTDIAMRGVFVPSGHSTVEFRYRPSSFREGIVIALVGFLALLAVLVGPTVVARRNRRVERA